MSDPCHVSGFRQNRFLGCAHSPCTEAALPRDSFASETRLEDISRLRVFVGTVFHTDDPDTMWYQHKRMIRKEPGADDFVLDPVQPAEPEVREEPLPLAIQKSKRGRPESQPL